MMSERKQFAELVEKTEVEYKEYSGQQITDMVAEALKRSDLTYKEGAQIIDRVQMYYRADVSTIIGRLGSAGIRAIDKLQDQLIEEMEEEE